ncbi:DNA-binding response regulator [Idiomarina fontislapidosi]|uniref:DNA-binding response regulator n=2 Tax=Idiomarina fontislapidosi TaxID=263723 RepID=A0A432YAR4_9GAMM|nr:DNA-binding response regulator [Idiomarina fontislapidosi]
MDETMQQTVYVVDDDELIQESLSLAFEQHDFAVACFSTAQDFLSHSQHHELPDQAALVLDLSLPDMHGLEVQTQLTQLGVAIPIIIYSGTADVPHTVKALTQGAYTLLQKPVSITTLVKTVQKAVAEFSTAQRQRQRVKQAQEQINKLSKRECDVARLAAQGLSAQKIAETLFISPRTAEAHKSNIFNKLGINSVASLAQYFALADTHH